MSSNEIDQEYREVSSLCENFEREIVNQLKTTIQECNVDLGFPIQSRVKTLQSIQQKIESGRFATGKSILEMEDLVGFRIILLFKRDLDPVLESIRLAFKILKEYDTVDRLQNNQFGYGSKHLIFELPKNWLDVPSMNKFKDLKGELQVRTLSQHLWSEVSHKLQYKQESNVPKEVQRSINRVSAILELVDLEFERVLVEKQEYSKKITTESDELKGNLNVDSLKTMIQKYLPNRIEPLDNMAELLDDLEVLGYGKAEQLELLFKNHLKEVIKMESEMVIKMKSEIEQPSKAYSVDTYKIKGAEKRILENNKYFVASGILRAILSIELNEEWDIAKSKILKQRKKEENQR